MTKHNVIDFSKPEIAEPHPAINLQISANRLIGLLNSLDSYSFELGRRKFVDNDLVFVHDCDRKLWDLTESIRDEISAHRNGTTADDIRASMPKA